MMTLQSAISHFITQVMYSWAHNVNLLRIKCVSPYAMSDDFSIVILVHFLVILSPLKKKWSQNGSSLDPFWKTAPLFKSGAVFFLNNHF